MHLCINWSPELGVWTVYPDGSQSRRRTVTPYEIAEGGKLFPVAEAFHQAREAVESGRAVLGICCEV